MRLLDETAHIVSNECLHDKLYLMKFDAARIAAGIQPGQFVHMRIPGMDDHILRRPFSIYDCDRACGQLEILYQTVGFGSARMTALEPGETLSLIGPVGTPWSVPSQAQRVLLVGGGLGAAPLFMLCATLVRSGISTDVVLGATTRENLVCRDRYAALLGVDPICATDDGSFGYHGFCTEPAAIALKRAQQEGNPYDYLAVCGPEPLMRGVAEAARDAQVYCQVSMERRMACGVGACLSCVVDTTEGKKRACVDGPIFDADKVVWE